MFRRICLLIGLMQALSGSGERVALLGDSMTWLGGAKCDNAKGWTSHYAQMNNDTLYVYARSGATWTHTAATRGSLTEVTGRLSDNNVIYSQVLRLLNDVDAGLIPRPERILIYAGTNDAWFTSERPGIFGLDASTSLTGAVTLCCDLLQQTMPQTTITLMTPPLFPKAPAERIHQVSDSIQMAGERLSVPTLRADRQLLLDPATDTTDGVHTNPAGAAKIARYIAEKF